MFNSKVVYEPGDKNLCDYASRHPQPLPKYKNMTIGQREDLGIKGEEEDSSFSINRVVIDGEDGSLTKDDLVRETAADKVLVCVVNIVKQKS